MLALGGLYSFSTDRKSRALQRSSISLVGISNKMESGIGFGLRSKQNLFFDNNNIRYVGRLSFGNQSEYYWGVGYDKGVAQSQSSDTSMDYQFVDYDADLTFRVKTNWYIGPVFRLRYYNPKGQTYRIVQRRMITLPLIKTNPCLLVSVQLFNTILVMSQ